MPLGALSAFGRTSLQTIRLRRSSECLNAPQGIVCFQTVHPHTFTLKEGLEGLNAPQGILCFRSIREQRQVDS